MAKLSSDLFTIHLRHRDVEHENVGAQFFDARQAFFTTGRLANEFKLWRAIHEMPDSLPNERMIVGKHDADRLHDRFKGT